MKYAKGTSGNPSGRPKGAKGKTPALLKDIIVEAISNYSSEQITQDMNALNPHQRLKIYCQLVQLITPRPKEIEEKTPEKIEVVYHAVPEINGNFTIDK